MPRHKKTRCSSLPMNFECAGSLEPCDNPYKPPSKPAATGTAAHEAIEHLITLGEADLPTLAAAHDVDLAELQLLYHLAAKQWESLRSLFPDAYTEVRLKGPIANGTADIVHHDGFTAAVLDWKFGREQQPSTIYQLMGYADALRHEHGMPESGVITAVVVWVRLDIAERYELTEAMLDDFRGRYKSQSKLIGKQYAPGHACAFCPRRLVCGALADYQRSGIRAMTTLEPSKPVTGEQLAALYSQSRELKKMLEQYDKALRLAVSEGPLQTEDGRWLQMTERRNSSLDVGAAHEALTSMGWSPQDIDKACKMSLTKIKDVAKASAGDERGAKTKAIAAVVNALESSGALTYTTSEAIGLRKDKP